MYTTGTEARSATTSSTCSTPASAASTTWSIYGADGLRRHLPAAADHRHPRALGNETANEPGVRHPAARRPRLPPPPATASRRRRTSSASTTTRRASTACSASIGRGGNDIFASDDTSAVTLIVRRRRQRHVPDRPALRLAADTAPIIPAPTCLPADVPRDAQLAEPRQHAAADRQRRRWRRRLHRLQQPGHADAERSTAGNDHFTVRSFLDFDTGQYIVKAPIAIDGGSGVNDLLVIGTERDDAIAIDRLRIVGAGNNIFGANLQILVVDAMEADDDLYVQATNPGTATTVYRRARQRHDQRHRRRHRGRSCRTSRSRSSRTS